MDVLSPRLFTKWKKGFILSAMDADTVNENPVRLVPIDIQPSSIPTALQSSTDSNQISLTIQSVGKSVAGIIVLIAMIKGVDPLIAQDQWMQTVALFATAAPAVYTVWQCMEGLWGIGRKLLISLFPKKTI